MKSPKSQPEPPVIEPESDAAYTLEILAKISGASTETILHYQEHGLIRARGPHFDDEALHAVRRMEHLRETCGLNLRGQRLLADLLEEVEQLRAELRALR
jgi:DNA-binding transcriptional MerR regulator